MSRQIVRQLSATDPVMAGLIAAVGPYRLAEDLECVPFQALAKAIAHQQLHGKAAQSILNRFVAVIGKGSFPAAEMVAAAPVDTLRSVGLSFAKIASLQDLAAKTLDGVVPDRQTLAGLSNEEVIDRLTQVRGIGRWTVEMMLMFNFSRGDILPVDDFGVRYGFQLVYGLRKMPRQRVLALYGERWSPNRTAAAWYLWRAVELHRAGKLAEPAERVKLPRLPVRKRIKRAVRKVVKKALSRRARK